MNLRFYLFISDVNQGNEREREVGLKFHCVTPGVLEGPHSLFAGEVG